MTARDKAMQLSRRALLFLSGSALWPVARADSITILFAEEQWYRARPEREEERTGVLRKRQPGKGPNSRSALRYTFHDDKESLFVYAPAKLETFERLTGKRVTALGKLVDLSAEGFGLELWIGSIRTGSD
jgi:hypothetical protein